MSKKIEDISEQRDWFLYMILGCNNAFYTGITKDPLKRLKAHCQKKGAKYFYSNIPLQLKILMSHLTKGEALAREAKIKKLSSKEKKNLFYGVKNLS
jgi:putative endonuclease